MMCSEPQGDPGETAPIYFRPEPGYTPFGVRHPRGRGRGCGASVNPRHGFTVSAGVREG